MLPSPTRAILSGGPMTALATDLLSYRDNLDVLRRYLSGTIRISSTVPVTG